jgi:ubiquinone/menaquinone biosynthesis C-methylase UbiE
MWKSRSSPDFLYFAKYDTVDATEPFWSAGTPFARAFSQLDLSRTLEIACGTGRHSARIIDLAGSVYMIDTSPDALDIARARFAEYPNVQVLGPTDGKSIPLDSGSVTAVFCFDAMVHFEATTVANYLCEIRRVLTRGGRALLHHSVYDKNPTGTFRHNPGWRNYMSQSLIAYLASRAGLSIISSIIFNERQEVTMLDGLSLLQAD